MKVLRRKAYFACVPYVKMGYCVRDLLAHKGVALAGAEVSSRLYLQYRCFTTSIADTAEPGIHALPAIAVASSPIRWDDPTVSGHNKDLLSIYRHAGTATKRQT
jgi:hypothetical protein